MQSDVAVERIREVRPERRVRRLVLGELGLGRERQVRDRTDLARVADPRGDELGPVEGVALDELWKVRRDPLPLRDAALTIAPGL